MGATAGCVLGLGCEVMYSRSCIHTGGFCMSLQQVAFPVNNEAESKDLEIRVVDMGV